ncbi:fumarylacetoacetate hydrolase family protein [Limnochorda pilosa]|uniref:Fumarylacetoacetase-like C-terminal domain-containing protein n=1 Tax=Limnochorda pilosa TaxID=1555112 RepID=A0A0K2SJF1_LIMPI|nr:fumarylacetoacetate hydrolase family protein [Limnochorda pilosa]BAS26979.1 hypothetical protein LIP_1122 [Limnochorda pilosa]
MRYASYRLNGADRVGLIEEDRIYDLMELIRLEGEFELPAEDPRPRTMLDVLRLGPELWSHARGLVERAERHRTSDPDRWEVLKAQGSVLLLQELEARGGRLVAPIPRPAKNLVCLGRNYRAHAVERGEEVPEVPVFFTKAPTCVIGPGEPIRYPEATRMLDYEGELAVVIGVGGRQIAKEHALDHVFGYTILNDVTARDLQRRHGQWFRGKSLDTFGPMGPWIVPAAEVPDPQALRIRTWVNGELRQDASTSQMVFSVAETIAWLSDGITLEPGDILSTGTPAGVGESGGDATLLHPGDVVRIEVEGIGTLENRVE